MKTIIYNGKIRTKENCYSSALCIKDNKIEAIGTDEEIKKLVDSESKMIDLNGKLVLPGFNDSHMHFLNNGYFFTQVDLRHTSSIEEVISRGRNFIKKNPPQDNKWIQCFGWNEDYWTEKRMLTKEDLDLISKEIPIVAVRVCVHICVLNSKALELLNINEYTQQPDKGHFDVDADGKPNGVLYEMVPKVYEHMPEYCVEEIKDMLIKASDSAAAVGLTSVQTDDFQSIPGHNMEKIVQAYNELVNEGKLKVRIYEQCCIKTIAEYISFKNNGYFSGRGNNKFLFGPLKTFCDGSLGGRTAWLDSPYSDDENTVGVKLYETEELERLVEISHKDHMAVAIHAIGDAAINQAIDAIKKAQDKYPEIKNRHGIVHSQIMSENLIRKMKEEHIIAYVQPIFMEYDLHMAEDRVGKKRLENSYNYRKMYDYGILIPFGTDSPVESFNPMLNLYCAVTGKDFEGNPENGWYTNKLLTLDESIKCYTEYSAYASKEESMKGKIQEGYLADLVVLEENIFSILPNKIKDVKVSMTIMDGEITYFNL